MMAGGADAGGQMPTTPLAADDSERSQSVLGWAPVCLRCCSSLIMEVGRQMSN